MASQEYDHEVYYGDPKTLDLNKMREEAEKKRRGDIRNPSQSTRIHFHRSSTSCEGAPHEVWERRA